MLFKTKNVFFADASKKNDPVCSSSEFMCDKACLSKSLRCNGIKNCPSGQDELQCGEKEEGMCLNENDFS